MGDTLLWLQSLAALTKEAVTLKGQRLVKFNKFAVGRLPPSPTTGICHCGGAPRGVGTSWVRVYSHRNHICKEANVVTVSVGFYLKKPIKKRPIAKEETTPKVLSVRVRQSRPSPTLCTKKVVKQKKPVAENRTNLSELC